MRFWLKTLNIQSCNSVYYKCIMRYYILRSASWSNSKYLKHVGYRFVYPYGVVHVSLIIFNLYLDSFIKYEYTYQTIFTVHFKSNTVIYMKFIVYVISLQHLQDTFTVRLCHTKLRTIVKNYCKCEKIKPPNEFTLSNFKLYESYV